MKLYTVKVKLLMVRYNLGVWGAEREREREREREIERDGARESERERTETQPI